MSLTTAFLIGGVCGAALFWVLLRVLLSAPAGSKRAALGLAVIQKAGGPPPP